MRKIVLLLVVVAIIATTGTVFALNYEGEDFCRDTPAWPNGTYLGQMHPYHSDFYTRYANARNWDPCETWASDQRDSAIRGLRESGYYVEEYAPNLSDSTWQNSGVGPHLSSQFTIHKGIYYVRVEYSNNRRPGSFSTKRFHASMDLSTGGGPILTETFLFGSADISHVIAKVREDSTASISVNCEDSAKWQIRIFRVY